MDDRSRDARLSAAFVKMADTLVDDYDVVDLVNFLLRECTELSGSDAGGLMIEEPGGELQLLASTSEEVAFVEINQLNAGDGPCVEAFRTGTSVSVSDISTVSDRWAVFRAAATAQGYRSVHAFPMKLRGHTIGALNLFRVTTGELPAADAAVTQALADVATIGILQERAVRDTETVAAQLRHALESRVVIEQAKGVIAAQTGVGMRASFELLRTYARTNQLKLSTVARDVAELTLVLPSPHRVSVD